METRTANTRAPAVRPGPAARSARAAALLLGLGLGGAVAAQAPEEAPVETRSFAIPDTRYAAALMHEARRHVEAERWLEAIADLQELILEHRGEVLGATRPELNGSPSRQDVHAGAAEEARKMLLALPRAARAMYADRYEQSAQAELDAARTKADRRALIAVTRRYPLTEAALHAWWTIGDIELELANPESAQAAWRRAETLARALELPLTTGAEARLSFRAPALLSDTPAAGDVGDAETGAVESWPNPPGPDCDSWSRRIDGESQSSPFSRRGENYNLYPFLAGDTLLVSNSMRLFAFDAWSGAELWRTDEAPGWDRVDKQQIHAQNARRLSRDDFFNAVEYDSVRIAPAASGGIAVAALQIPVTQLGNTRYQNIPITRVIPDRRLFAFDLESGRPLWNHMPPPLWDGESGNFQQRMRIAAPPVIAGSRILVPTYRMQGRINYNLACYDLFTGALHWSTSLISGQLPLNMFGRHQKEFAAAPVHVEGDRVIALTQLGAIAAVDLYTGDILWETLYEQIPLPPTVHWTAPRRDRAWTNSPPVVADGVVVATPLDSREMIGLDLETGTMHWSLPKRRIPERAFDDEELSLVGAADDTVWLSGSNVIACRAPRGLAGNVGPIDVLYGEYLFDDREIFPRPALTERHVIVPTDHRRVVLERHNVRLEDRRNSSEWGPDGYAGNLLLEDGALFSLNSKYITACLDWSILERRRLAALEADPNNDQRALAYASLLERRGLGELNRGSLAGSLDLLARARKTLEPRIQDSAAGSSGSLRAGLHRVLRGEARAFELQANSNAAIERLERARQLAPSRTDLRDTLLDLAELRARAGDEDAWFAVLEELDEQCGDLAWSQTDGAGPDDIGLWVRTQRAHAHARAGRTQAELEELHSILARWGDVGLPPTEPTAALVGAPRTRVTARISERLDQEGRSAYAPFEARARRMFEDANASEDLDALELLCDLYPHSEAARAAGDARLAAALDRRDTAGAVQIVQRAIPDAFSLQRSTLRDGRLLLELARALEAVGNVEFADALRSRLAEVHPDLVAGSSGSTPRAVPRELPSPAELSTFDDQALQLRSLAGEYIRLGRLPSSGAQILARLDKTRHSVVAFDEDSVGEPLWTYELAGERILGEPGSPCHLTAERVVIAGRTELRGLDAADGTSRWTWRSSGEVVTTVTGASGVTLVTTEADKGATLTAIDTFAGTPLWRRSVPRGFWSDPVAGDGYCVLLPQGAKALGRAQVLDLFTGSLAREFPLDSNAIEGDVEGAWIEEGALILPRFPKSSGGADCVIAIDLADGRRRWNVAGDPDRAFDSIARHGSEVYLIFAAESQPGMIQQLDTRLGAVRRIQGVSLDRGDVPIGIKRHRVTQLDGPYMFLRSEERGGRGTLLRAVQLPFGERWTYRLSIDPDELYHVMPLPALSRTTVAFAYTDARRSVRAKPKTSLLLVNRNNGTPQDVRLLDSALGKADELEFAMFGRALAILGSDQLLFLSR